MTLPGMGGGGCGGAMISRLPTCYFSPHYNMECTHIFVCWCLTTRRQLGYFGPGVNWVIPQTPFIVLIVYMSVSALFQWNSTDFDDISRTQLCCIILVCILILFRYLVFMWHNNVSNANMLWHCFDAIFSVFLQTDVTNLYFDESSGSYSKLSAV